MPLIVSWPGKVKKGSVSLDMVNLMDVFATVCDITDGRLPRAETAAPDSFSFLSSLTGRQSGPKRTSMVTANADGMHALRMGDWKYIDNATPQAWSEGSKQVFPDIAPQLYNVKDDPRESRNVIDRNPALVRKMVEELKRLRQAQSSR